MDSLSLHVDHSLRSFRLALELTVEREIVAVVGASGAGKTTLLRVVAGLVRPESGRVAAGENVWLDTAQGVDLAPEARSVGFVFQDYALFPHMTVARNVAYGGSGEQASMLLERIGIAHLANARPAELSGGERQRVALARALCRDPAVLLLDEPLSALDTQTRAAVRAELGRLLADVRLPTIVVSHDYIDAATLATRIAVLSEGRIVQMGTPAELTAMPASPFVAEFTGVNLIPGEARRAHGLTEITLRDGTKLFAADPLAGSVGVRVYPWDVAVSRHLPDDSTRNHLRARISSVVPLGDRVRVRIGPVTAEITAASADELRLREGEEAVASFKATATRLVPLG